MTGSGAPNHTPRARPPRSTLRLLGGLALVALGACESIDRAVRVSPFSGEQPSDDRVNLFPIAYWDGHDGAAVLWPLADFDDSGFAIRPLVHKEDSVVSVAYPLSNINLDERTGWVGPLYRFEHNYGLFPLFNQGDDTDWIGPLYRTGDQRGFFPLAHLGGDVSYVGPVWWTETPEADEDDADSPHDEDAFGVFPLFAKGPFSHAGPVYWSDFDADGTAEARGVFPLVHSTRNADEQTDRFLLSLAGSCRSDDERTDWVAPLWYRSRARDESDHVLFPFFYDRQREDRRSLVTPLGGRGWSTDGSTRFVNVLGPLFHRSHGGEETTTSFLWPAFVRRTSPETTSTRAFPLFGHTTSDDGSHGWVAAGLGGYRLDEQGSTVRAWPLFSVSDHQGDVDGLNRLALFARHEDDHGAELQIGTNLLFKRWSTPRDADERVTETRLLTFFKTRSFDQAATPVPDPGSPHILRRRRAGFLFDWFKQESSTTQAWKHDSAFELEEQTLARQCSETDPSASDEESLAVFRDAAELLQRHGVHAETPSDVQAAVRDLVEPELIERTDRHTRIPLLFDYDRSGESSEWSALLGAVQSVHHPHRSGFRVLYALYKTETEGERTTRDLFPFLTWDTAPEETEVSFLWRLFRYENKGGDRSGHVLFIPWD